MSIRKRQTTKTTKTTRAAEALEATTALQAPAPVEPLISGDAGPPRAARRKGRRRTRALAVSLAALVGAGALATVAPEADAIVGGMEVPEETSGANFVARVNAKWDFQSPLLEDQQGLCTGSLVHPAWVLTAAHCVKLDRDFYGRMADGEELAKPAGVTVQFGTRANKMTETRSVSEIIVHPNYTNWKQGNDLALLHLKTASDKRPIKLGIPSEAQYWGTGPDAEPTNGEAYGWGQVSGDPNVAMPTALRSTILQIKPDWDLIGAVFTGDTEIHIDDKPGRSTCQGDSGGPLVVSTPNHPSPRLVGVTSYGQKGCTGWATMAEVGAGPYQTWIRSMIPDIDDPVVPEAPNARFDYSGDKYKEIIEPDGHRLEQSAASRNVAASVRSQQRSGNIARRDAVDREAPMNLYSAEADDTLSCYQDLHNPNGNSYQLAMGEGFSGHPQVFAADGAVFTVRQNGELAWRRHDGAPACTADWSGAATIGTGWGMFNKVFAMETGVPGNVAFYGVKPNGDMHWYLYRCARTGGGVETVGCWSGGHKVRSAMSTYKTIFAGGHGVIYAINADGKLYWMSHDGYRDGSNVWDNPREVGRGWNDFTQVFSGTNDGDIYAVTADGTMFEYRHFGFARGTGLDTPGSWADRTQLFIGWTGQAFAMTAG